MKPSLLLASLGAVLVLLVAARADETPVKSAKTTPEKTLPRLESADLNGEKFVIPGDFKAPRTLLLIAFEREHQSLVDSWSEGLGLKSGDKDWYELPVVGEMGKIGKVFLDNAMRSGIRGQDKRAHVITLYMEPTAITGALGKTKTDTIYVAVVGKDGKVLELTEGKFDKTKATQIKAKWRAAAKK